MRGFTFHGVCLFKGKQFDYDYCLICAQMDLRKSSLQTIKMDMKR